MSAHELILTAAAGGVSLAICAVLWALAHRWRVEAQLRALAGRLAEVQQRAEAAQASAEAFDSALLSVEDGQASLASGEESLAACGAALGLDDARPRSWSTP
jgi:hypothetical protein